MRNFLPGLGISVLSAATVFLNVSCSKPNPEVDGDRPVITSISPTTAKGGEVITVYGNKLLNGVTSFEISINNKVAQVASSSNDSIKIIVPPKAGSGPVAVTINGVQYSGPEFIYDWVGVVSTLAGSGAVGNSDGAGGYASFNCPWGIAVDKNGDLYIADSYNRLIRKIDTHTRFVSSISIPITINGASFYSPYNLTQDTITGSLYITDFNAHLLKISETGDMSVIFQDAQPMAGVGVGPDSKVYITNNSTGDVIRIDTTGQNPMLFAQGLITPRNIIFDKDHVMYIAGLGIYKMNGDGSYSELINPANLFHGWEIAIDTMGSFYEADHFNNVIRMIDKHGIKVIAGNGNASDVDGIGSEASFNGPMGIAIDKEGNLFVSTYNFDTQGGNKIRKISLE